MTSVDSQVSIIQIALTWFSKATGCSSSCWNITKGRSQCFLDGIMWCFGIAIKLFKLKAHAGKLIYNVAGGQSGLRMVGILCLFLLSWNLIAFPPWLLLNFRDNWAGYPIFLRIPSFWRESGRPFCSDSSDFLKFRISLLEYLIPTVVGRWDYKLVLQIGEIQVQMYNSVSRLDPGQESVPHPCIMWQSRLKRNLFLIDCKIMSFNDMYSCCNCHLLGNW